MRRWLVILMIAAVACGATGGARAERIKDIVDIKGVRGNPLIGYGIVTGLQGTGDGSAMSKRAMAAWLRREGLIVKPDDIDGKNVAFVVINAELGPFSVCGSKLDVIISTVGNATSLQGGELQMTGLKGADGQVYAVAQGPIAIGGFAATGKASAVSKNHTTTGQIPGGAIVEREELAEFVQNGEVILLVRNPDFTTAENIAQAVNGLYPHSSMAASAATIRVRVPPQVRKPQLAKFIRSIGELLVKVDQPAVVVINERTGTIIVGENVGISTVAISHGNLYIITEEKEFVSQPVPFSKTGQTETIERTSIQTTEERRPLSVVPHQVSVSELARALNAMGLTPRDLISIFSALRRQGALQADLKIM